MRSSSWTAFAISVSGIGLGAPGPGEELSVSPLAAKRIAARARRKTIGSAEGLDEEDLAGWRAGRDAIYQLALTIGAQLAVSDNYQAIKRNPRRESRGFRRSAIEQRVIFLTAGAERRASGSAYNAGWIAPD